MEIRLLSFSLPNNLKTDLSRLAFGLTETIWLDQNELHLPICQFETPNSSYDLDVIEILKTSLIPNLALTINRPHILLPKSGKGQIILRIKEIEMLEKLKLSLERSLKKLPIKLKSAPEQLSIPLAAFENISDQRLADWMEAHAFFPPIEFSPLELWYEKPQVTAKNKFFFPIGKFPLQKNH